jgi:hypothetical protein
LENPLTGILYTRIGDADPVTGWSSRAWDFDHDFSIKPTKDYYGNEEDFRTILSTPFLFYFGLRPGNTGLDKFIERFGPTGVFKTVN